jgi:hypothetical protein
MAPQTSYPTCIFGGTEGDGYAADTPAYLYAGEDAADGGEAADYWKGMGLKITGEADTTAAARKNNAKGMVDNSVYKSCTTDVTLTHDGNQYPMPFLHLCGVRLLYTEPPVSKPSGDDDSTARRARIFLPDWVVRHIQRAARDCKPVDPNVPIANGVRRDAGIVVAAYGRDTLMCSINLNLGDSGEMEVQTYTLVDLLNTVAMDVDVVADMVLRVDLKFSGAVETVKGKRQERGAWKVSLTPMHITVTDVLDEAMAPKVGGAMAHSDKSFRDGQVASDALAKRLERIRLNSVAGGE